MQNSKDSVVMLFVMQVEALPKQCFMSGQEAFVHNVPPEVVLPRHRPSPTDMLKDLFCLARGCPPGNGAAC